MKKDIAVLAKHRRKVFCDGRVASMSILGIKASSVAPVQIFNNCGKASNLFHLIINEETHLRVKRKTRGNGEGR